MSSATSFYDFKPLDSKLPSPCASYPTKGPVLPHLAGLTPHCAGAERVNNTLANNIESLHLLLFHIFY